jgi:ribosome biogenesis GTPase
LVCLHHARLAVVSVVKYLSRMTFIPQKIRGRVITEHKASYIVSDGIFEYVATIRGHFHEATQKQFPKVGDFVQLTVLEDEKGIIESIEKRASEVIRKSAHDDTLQVMVTNVDFVFIVMGLDADFNLRRLERYLVLSEQAGITPIVILNKADVVDDAASYVMQAQEVSGKAEVFAISAETGENMDVFDSYLKNDKTAVLLGSSGAGKSTITNYLLKRTEQDTKTVRELDSRGRHTTTVRQLFKVPTGGYLIDTPGMRELGFVSDEEITEGTFADIESLTQACKFTNCDHVKSAGCAVQEALQKGELDQKHFDNYLKLQARKAETRNARRRD